MKYAGLTLWAIVIIIFLIGYYPWWVSVICFIIVIAMSYWHSRWEEKKKEKEIKEIEDAIAKYDAEIESEIRKVLCSFEKNQCTIYKDSNRVFHIELNEELDFDSANQIARQMPYQCVFDGNDEKGATFVLFTIVPPKKKRFFKSTPQAQTPGATN